MKHACIKPGCSNTYEDDDPDAYYCPSCLVVIKEVAKKIDAEHNTREQHREPSALEQFEAAQKQHGRFVPLSALQ